MNGTHNTPVGTPVVIAPGKIPLVGEYAVLEEGTEVLAAIARHAKAQFIPRMADSMSPLVSEVVKRTKAGLGEVSAALPPGAVLVNIDDLVGASHPGGFGTSAAIAVASIGAVFESLGLAIENRKPEILDIAEAARQAARDGVGSGAELAAAAHGGLIGIIRKKDAVSQVEPLALPAGLHLALFSVDQSLPTHLVVEGVRQHARNEPADFVQAGDELREIAHRFVEETKAGSATGAVVAAGRYGHKLAELSAAASVPIMTDAFTRASDLARELGGIAKPVGVGGGDIGVALFATPEAASLFRRACTPPLHPLDGGLDRLGVRRQPPEADEDSEPIVAQCCEADGIVLQPEYDVVTIECRAEFADTDPVRIEPALALVPTRQFSSATRGARRRLVRASSLALALVFVAWMAAPNSIRARVHGTQASPFLRGGSAKVVPAVPADLPMRAAGIARHSETNDLPTAQPVLVNADAALTKSSPGALVTQTRKSASEDLAAADATRARRPASHPRAPADPAPPRLRAGKLSAADF